MPDIWMDVDTAVTVPLNIMPLIAVSDFKTVLASETYNEAGLEIIWNFVTTAGVQTHVAVTPTDTAGVYDWVNIGHGMYNIEIPASGGASANNDTEGTGWFTGIATDALPWRGPTIGFRRAALNDLLIDGSTASTNLEDFFDGTGYAGGTAKLTVDVTKWNGQAVVAPNVNGIPLVDVKYIFGTILAEGGAGRLAAGFNKQYDVASPVFTAASVNQTGNLYADWADGGRLDLLLDAIKVPTDKLVFTVANKIDANVYTWNGTAVSAPATAGIPEVNIKNIANAAVSTTTAQIGTNVVQISGDATAADNEESFFDGTGYAGTNNVIPTVTSSGLSAAGVGAILDHAIADHLTAGTMGNYIAQGGADIDVEGNESIYTIGAVEIKRFELKDAAGDPTMTNVYTRITHA